VYLKSIDELYSETSLIFAKTRLVTVDKGKGKCKKLSIPRLEFKATLIDFCVAEFIYSKRVGFEHRRTDFVDRLPMCSALIEDKETLTYFCRKPC